MKGTLPMLGHNDRGSFYETRSRCSLHTTPAYAKVLNRAILVLGLVLASAASRADQYRAIAITGDRVPEGNGFFDDFLFSPVLNSAGQIAFNARLKTGGSADDSGIYLFNGTSLVNRVREN